MKPPRVLAIGGSDPSGGAGIQADVKTVTMLGGYAMAAITALTVQNSVMVSRVDALEGELIAAQIGACIADIGVDAVKIGMLPDEDAVLAVAAALAGVAVPIVLDPVLAASTGAMLATAAARAAMVERLFPLATLLTPNLPELAALTGNTIATEGDVLAAGAALAVAQRCHVLVKGGHAAGEVVTDQLFAPDGTDIAYTARRIATRHTHGTGCTLASAIATRLGAGDAMPDAVVAARAFVRAALAAAPGYGAGVGPLGHAAAKDSSLTR